MTDVKPMWATLHNLKAQLFEEESARLQAERAQEDAEEVARRAEERATQAADDRDGWRMLARDLLTPMLFDHEPDLTRDALERITDLAYDLHSQGREISSNVLAELVNDWSQA